MIISKEYIDELFESVKEFTQVQQKFLSNK
jgi:hypothetical protein